MGSTIRLRQSNHCAHVYSVMDIGQKCSVVCAGRVELDPKPYLLFNNTLEQQMPLKSGQHDWALYYALCDESSDTEDRQSHRFEIKGWGYYKWACPHDMVFRRQGQNNKCSGMGTGNNYH